MNLKEQKNSELSVTFVLRFIFRFSTGYETYRHYGTQDKTEEKQNHLVAVSRVDVVSSILELGYDGYHKNKAGAGVSGVELVFSVVKFILAVCAHALSRGEGVRNKAEGIATLNEAHKFFQYGLTAVHFAHAAAR